MANKNFVVHNGLTVGPLEIDAATGNLITQGNILVAGDLTTQGTLAVEGDLDVIGNISISGDLGVSQISKNDSSISINDTGIESTVVIAIDGATAATIDADGIKLPSGDAFHINGTSVLDATTLGSGVVNSNLTSVGTLISLAVTGNIASGNLSATNLTGTLLTASQPNITAVGTLGVLSVAGNISAGNVSATNLTATNLTGTLLTASQPNITAVGNLTALSASGTVQTTGQVYANSNVVTTSTSTGAVVVAGGVGISGGLQTGADIYIAGSIAATVDDAAALAVALG
jgi:hypothetical protein